MILAFEVLQAFVHLAFGEQSQALVMENLATLAVLAFEEIALLAFEVEAFEPHRA
jgi:hypothetical protein